jgi:hypothetical protein
MAVNEQVRVLRGAKITRKGEKKLDIPAFGQDPTWLYFDYVVKPQLETPRQVERV